MKFSVGAVPKNTKAKKARNAKKAAGKVLQEKGLGSRVPGGSAEIETGPCNEVIPRRITCRDFRKYVYAFVPVLRLFYCILLPVYIRHDAVPGSKN